jgi:hypothetical protein
MINHSVQRDIEKWISLLNEEDSFSNSLAFLKQMLEQEFEFSLHSFESLCSLLKNQKENYIDVFESISSFHEKYSISLPSDLIDEILATLSSDKKQSLPKSIESFLKIVSLLSEDQSQKAIQIFSSISLITEQLITLFWKLIKQNQDESSLIPIWKTLFTNYSDLISKFLFQYYFLSNKVQKFLQICSNNIKAIGILKTLLIMIKNIQCLHVWKFRSLFYLDSDFIQIQFKDENITSIIASKHCFLISIFHQLQNWYSKKISFSGDPNQILISDQIIEAQFEDEFQPYQNHIDFSIFKNLPDFFPKMMRI